MRLTKTTLVLLIAVLLLSACKPFTPTPSPLSPSPSASASHPSPRHCHNLTPIPHLPHHPLHQRRARLDVRAGERAGGGRAARLVAGRIQPGAGPGGAAALRRRQLDRPGDLHLVRWRGHGGGDEPHGLFRLGGGQPRVRFWAGGAANPPGAGGFPLPQRQPAPAQRMAACRSIWASSLTPSWMSPGGRWASPA